MRKPSLPVVLVALAVALCVRCSAAPVQTLDELAALFETDPAAGFEEAARMFEAPKAKGDLEGMLGLAGVVGQWATRCYYGRVWEDTLLATAESARNQGAWETAARMYRDLAEVATWWGARDGLTGDPACISAAKRQVKALTAAEECRARAGRPVEVDSELHQTRARVEALAQASRDQLAKRFGLDYAEQAGRVDDLVGEWRDEEALVAFRSLLSRAGSDARRWDDLCARMQALLPLRGWEAVAADLQLLAGNSGDLGPNLWRTQAGACVAWSGRDGAMLSLISWATPNLPPVCGHHLRRKMRCFGRDRGADEIDALYLKWQMAHADTPAIEAPQFIAPTTPASVRRQLLDWGAEACLASTHPAPTVAALMEGNGSLAHCFPPEQHQAYWGEAAGVLRQAAVGFGVPARAREGLEGAAILYGQADRPDLAEECLDLAKAIAADDPKAMLSCALTSAQALAAEGKWEDVAKALEEPAGKHTGTVETLQAALLLHEAYLRTGKSAEAESWVQKAWELVNQVQMSPAEKANYLLSMANLCEVAVQMADQKAGGK